MTKTALLWIVVGASALVIGLLFGLDVVKSSTPWAGFGVAAGGAIFFGYGLLAIGWITRHRDL